VSAMASQTLAKDSTCCTGFLLAAIFAVFN
jgi:hypothetical protein